MRWLNRIIGFAGILLVGLALPAQAAESSLDARIESAGASAVSGSWNGTLSIAAIRHVASTMPLIDEMVSPSCSYTMELRDEPIQITELDSPGPAPGLHWEQLLPPSAAGSATGTGKITIHDLRPESDIRLFPNPAETHVASSLGLDVAVLEPPTPIVYAFDPQSSPDPVSPPRVAGHATISRGDLPPGHTVWTWYVYGPQIEVAGTDGPAHFQTGRLLDPSKSIVVPGTTLRANYYDRVYAVIHTTGCTPISLGANAGGWIADITSFSGSIVGDIAIQAAKVDAHINGTHVEVNAGLFQAIGAFKMEMQYAPGHSTWNMEGDASYVSIDAKTVAGQRPSNLALVAGAVGLGLLALLLGFLSSAGRETLTFITGYNFADPWQNDHRIAILRSISCRPGISRMELARTHVLSRRAATHHLQVLLRADLISIHQPGKIPGYFLNSGSAEFATASNASASAMEVFKAAQSPVRGIVVEALDHLRTATYNDMVDYWKARACPIPSRGKVAYHCRVLQSSNLVQAHSAGRQTRWTWKAELSISTAHQRRSILLASNLGPLLEEVRAMGSNDLSKLVARLPGWKPHSIKVGLKKLRAFGFLEN